MMKSTSNYTMYIALDERVKYFFRKKNRTVFQVFVTNLRVPRDT